jgi:hypothetical protein
MYLTNNTLYYFIDTNGNDWCFWHHSSTNSTATTIVQPNAAVPTGSITITRSKCAIIASVMDNQNSPVFANLVPGNYTIAVCFTNSPVCITGGIININALHSKSATIQDRIDCINNEFVLSHFCVVQVWSCPSNLSMERSKWCSAILHSKALTTK